MWQMNPRVAKSNPRHRGRQQHLAARFVVGCVGDSAGQKLVHDFEGTQRPDIADRVRPLVSRPIDGTGRHRALDRTGSAVNDSKSVAEDVEAGRGGDCRGLCAGIFEIDQSQRRFEVAVGDSRLHLAIDHIEDRHPGRFTPRSGGRGNGNERLERSGDWLSPADGRR